jgi:hypothetical protein
MNLFAIAELRLRESFAARLAWLVPAALLLGVAAARWAQGPDVAARAAQADRVVLWTVWGAAFAVGTIVSAVGLPSDVRRGPAQTLFASPASRFDVACGGVIGYAAFTSLLLAAMAAAAALGMQFGGLGARERAPIRPTTVADSVEPGEDGVIVVDATRPSASFRFRVPDGLAPDEAIRLRMAPHGRFESSFERATVGEVSLARPGQVGPARVRVEFKGGAPFTADVPRGDLAAGEEAEATFRRVSGGWKLRFEPDCVEVGGARRLWTTSLLVAALCAVPALLLLAAIGTLAAARFGTATAVLAAAFLAALLASRSMVLDGAAFILSAPSVAGEHGTPDATGAPTATQIALARGAAAVFGLLPRLDAFDRTDALVERRAPTLGDVGRSAGAGLPAAARAPTAAWLLLRRREPSAA